MTAWQELQERYPGITCTAKVRKLGHDDEYGGDQYWRVKFKGGDCPISTVDSCWGDADASFVIEHAAEQVLRGLPEKPAPAAEPDTRPLWLLGMLLRRSGGCVTFSREEQEVESGDLLVLKAGENGTLDLHRLEREGDAIH